MSLPVSPNRVYSPTTPVSSADLNDIQGQIAALWSGKHGVKYLHLPGIAAVPSFPGGVDDSIARQLEGLWASTAAVGGDLVYGYLPIPLLRGDRILSLAGFVYETGTSLSSVSLWRVSMLSGVLTQVGATETAIASAGYQKLDIDGLSEVVAEQRIYILRWRPGAADDRFLGAEATFDHP